MMTINETVQKDQYWEAFTLLPSDIEHLINFMVETERPHTVAELARELIRYRHEQAVTLMRDMMARGRIYRPREAYRVGETVIFPHLGNVIGEVIQVRPGRNPGYEPFSVIRVRVDGSDEEREFAAELKVDHPLNTASYVTEVDVEVDELVARHGAKVEAVLREALETSPQFVSVADRWFVRDLLMEVPPGQLNIAEALLYMHEGGPVPTEAFLAEMDLPAEIPDELKLFSLEYALLHDSRFDEVGPAGEALWYLKHMEPRQVLETPPHLRYVPIPYNRALLDESMLSLEQQVNDEWSGLPPAEEVVEPVTVVLTYPHWRSGTLPLAPHVVSLFPTARITDRIRFTFVDGRTREEFPGWVVRSGRYVYGLADWYEANHVQVGTRIDLRRGEEPGKIVVEVHPLRSRRREWIHTAEVEDGQLVLAVTQVPVYCQYDELAAVYVPDPEAVDVLAEQLRRSSLEVLLEQIFGNLAGLNLQRTVHGMTLYSVLNLVRRVPPAPMLAVLATSPKYVSLGNNYWAYRGEE